MVLTKWFSSTARSSRVPKEEQDLALAIKTSQDDQRRQESAFEEDLRRAKEISRLAFERQKEDQHQHDSLSVDSEPSVTIHDIPDPDYSSLSRLAATDEPVDLDAFVTTLLAPRNRHLSEATLSNTHPISSEHQASFSRQGSFSHPSSSSHSSDKLHDENTQSDTDPIDDDQQEDQDSDWSLEFALDDDVVNLSNRSPQRQRLDNPRKRTMASAISSSKRSRLMQPRPEQPRTYNHYGMGDDAVDDEFQGGGFDSSVVGLAWETRGQSRYA
ncbi:hypothetical protein DM01DRAFT_1161930 [Hesseltinella vesiculosa]|uniref:Uncharacterized protein n=1 Tax=Hesseltinella vesiculosa TaxID=101127 RepID=A0A1X2GT01_9FUNG|nr:hypothetical protein DM01DRAFT_1161930 [Hesseltinella vesiculosa]